MADVPLMNNPMTTAGDVIYGGASGAPTRLAVGTAGQVLTVNAGATAPEWAAATGGAGAVGLQLIAAAPGFIVATTNNTTPAASAGYLQPILIAAPMKVGSLVANMQAASSGTWQWGLFDYSSSATAATKLAGGSGTLNGTGFQSIAATSAPVDVDPGAYLLIVHAPAANTGSIYRFATAASLMAKSQASYVWDDTPDFTTGWATTTNPYQWFLSGYLNGSTAW